MPIGKTTFVLISVLTLSLLIIGTKYGKSSEEVVFRTSHFENATPIPLQLVKNHSEELELQKEVNNELIVEFDKLQHNYVDLQARYDTYFAPSSPADDSASLMERKICGVKYWDRTNCDPELWLECTNSMSEIFTCFSALVIYPSEHIGVGDIIGFKLPKTRTVQDKFGKNVSLNYIYHRVVGINGTRFITRADTDYVGRHNSVNDEFQPTQNEIIGKVKTISY